MKILKYIPVALLAFIYIIHGWQAIMLSDEFVQIAMQSGLPLSLAKIGVVIVGILDIALAVSLFIKPKKIILIWLALWPIVPAVLTYLMQGAFEPEFVITSVLAILVYFFIVKNKSLTT
jgi:uncharacterized membrane protein